MIDQLEPRLLLAANVTISEFMAANITGLKDETGHVADWIELHNSGDTDARLLGWHLTDSPTNLNKWTFPDVTLGAGQYMVIFADNADRRDPAQPLHTNFNLDAGGEYLALVAPDGVAKPTEFAPKYPQQQEDVSYGFDDSTGGGTPPLRYFATPSPGAPNQRAEVVINEIHYDPDVKTELVEFVELYNPGTAVVDLSGAAFTKGIDYTFPGGVILPPKGYLVIAQNPAQFQVKFARSALGPFTGSLSNAGEDLVIRNYGGGKLDEVDYGAGFPWPTVGDPYGTSAGTGPSIELINPDFDNNLGGNWRSSTAPGGTTGVTLVSRGATWDYRKGTSEASTPDITAWRQLSFVEDGTWVTNAAAPIGYDPSVSMGTPLSDMSGHYISFFMRKTFTVTDPSQYSSLRLEAKWDDSYEVWINGKLVARDDSMLSGYDLPYNVAAGNPPGANARENNNYISIPLSDSPSTLLVPGTNVIAVQVRNVLLSGSSDAFFDGSLTAIPASSRTWSPSPGAANSVYATNAPPLIRQVSVNGGSDSPVVAADAPVTITAKITDSDGVANVSLSYKLVDPGAYVTIDDPTAYNANWTNVSMRDDGLNGDAVAGDGIYTAVLPASMQTNRRLVRYRITATDGVGNSIRAPYADDEVPNFAYYVYAGVPGWSGAARPGYTPVVNYSSDLMNSLPVFQMIARSADITAGILGGAGYTGEDYPWHGTFIYDGKVYDDVGFRARGGVWRYAMGKNMWKISFPRNHEIQLRDNYGNPYPTKWSKLDLGACIQQGDYGYRGEQGLFESVSYKLYQLAGVPAPDTSFAELRVVDSAAETGATQYDGDLWGLYLALQPEDGNFLDDNGLPDGNLYKMDGGDTDPVVSGGSYVNQGPTQPTNFSDLTAFVNGYNSGPSEQWWRDNFDLDTYYSYRAIIEAVHQGDIGYGKNYFYYHNPETNKWTVIPWDHDLTWAETMFGNGNEPMKSKVLYTDSHYSGVRQPFNTEYQNRLREIIDLLYNPEQTGQLIDEMAAKIYTPGQPSFVDVDRAMWDYNPIMVSGYVNPSKSGQGRFYQASGGTFAGMIQHMKDYISYALNNTRNWMGDPSNGPSMLSLAADPAIPVKPTVSWVGGASHPVNALKFRSSYFSSPVGAGYAAMEWRIAEITDPNAPGYDPKAPPHYEIQSCWDSGELTTFTTDIQIPADAVQVGHAYRVRVKFKDSTGRWSNWSAPVQFIADAASSPVKDSLRIVEMDYNPANAPVGSPYSRDDFEFVEVKNTGSQTINLANAKFTNGISFTFPAVDLRPGESAVVSPNVDAFRSRYPSFDMKVLGPYTGHLDDGGEHVVLEDSLGQVINDFRYDNAWYPTTAGGGKTLVVVNPAAPSADWSTAANWQPSLYNNGTPGADECTLAPQSIVVNEVLSHTDAATGDWIELYNTTDADIPIGGWWLSDDYSNPQKFQIPAGEVIKAHDYATFTAVDDFNNPATARIPFSINEQGDDIVLTSANAFGVVSGWDEKQDFGAAEKDVTFGRYLASTGPQFVALSAPTVGSANAAPKVGPVVINEVMYAPAAGGDEYIELRNISSAAVPLYDPAHPENVWRFTGDIQYQFATGDSLDAGEIALLVPINPAEFRSKYNIPASVRIFGPYVGLLDDTEDTLTLTKPSDVEPGMPVGDIVVDRIHYTSADPWPANAAGTGASLSRINSQAFGNDPVNWQAQAGGSPGKVNFDSTVPTVSIIPISPNPNPGPINSITMTFSEPVAGFDLADLTLTRDGQSISLASATLDQVNDTDWTLSGLLGLTGTPGTYTLSLTAAGSGIADLAGNALASDASEQFINNRISGHYVTITASAPGLLQVQSDSNPAYTLALAGLPALQLGVSELRLVGDAADVVQIDADQIGFGGAVLQYDTLPSLDASGLAVSVGQASVSFRLTQHLSALSIASGGSVLLAGGIALVTDQLTLSTDATLDLADGTLIVQATAATANEVLAQINSAIASARNATPLWAGAGITSSLADDLHGLAAIRNADEQGKPLMGSFAGESVDANSILVKLTLNGDADLNGLLDGSDYFFIDKGFLSRNSANPPGGYRNGDFDYNGTIDGSDYFLIDKAFLSQRQIAAAPLSATASPFNSTRPIASPARRLLSVKAKKLAKLRAARHAR